MQTKKRRFPFADPRSGVIQLPHVPITLTYQGQSQSILGLLDTGATVNVLPYDIGRGLGAIWEQQLTSVRLTGNLSGDEARSLMVFATIEPFAPVKLVFAWTQQCHIPVILGQMNFFFEFDVCFFGSQGILELSPKHEMKGK